MRVVRSWSVFCSSETIDGGVCQPSRIAETPDGLRRVSGEKTGKRPIEGATLLCSQLNAELFGLGRLLCVLAPRGLLQIVIREMFASLTHGSRKSSGKRRAGLPFASSHPVGRGDCQLWGGCRALVSVARAGVRQPSVISETPDALPCVSPQRAGRCRIEGATRGFSADWAGLRMGSVRSWAVSVDRHGMRCWFAVLSDDEGLAAKLVGGVMPGQVCGSGFQMPHPVDPEGFGIERVGAYGLLG